ncbi:MAG: hypothetical protein QM691_12525 [Opitutaceae bacterium]
MAEWTATSPATRRAFLRTSVVAALAGGFWRSLFAQQAGPTVTDSVAPTAPAGPRLDYATFSALVDSPFRVHRSDGPAVVLRLAEANEERRDPALENFTLRFASRNPALQLAQGSYRFEHPALGEFDLFLVPGGRGDAGASFNVVFNRLRGAC